jgi:hypothetical protein
LASAGKNLTVSLYENRGYAKGTGLWKRDATYPFSRSISGRLSDILGTRAFDPEETYMWATIKTLSLAIVSRFMANLVFSRYCAQTG